MRSRSHNDDRAGQGLDRDRDDLDRFGRAVKRAADRREGAPD